jgi:hypothetical protein
MYTYICLPQALDRQTARVFRPLATVHRFLLSLTTAFQDIQISMALNLNLPNANRHLGVGPLRGPSQHAVQVDLPPSVNLPLSFLTSTGGAVCLMLVQTLYSVSQGLSTD